MADRENNRSRKESHDATALQLSQRREQQPRRQGRKNNRRRRGRPKSNSASQHSGRKTSQDPSLAPMIDGESPFPSVLARSSDSLQSDAATVNSGAEAEVLDSESYKSCDSQIRDVGTCNHTDQQQPVVAPVSIKQHADVDNDNNRAAYSLGVDISQCRQSESPASSSSEDKKPRARPALRLGEDSNSNVENQQRQDANAVSVGHGGGNKTVDKSSKFRNLALGCMTPGNHQELQESSKSKEDGASSLEVEMNSSPSSHSLYSQHSLEAPADQGDGDDSKDDITPAPSGRRSPGGTTYVGKGSRQYQGRYMNLALRRFHEEGIDPKSFHGERNMGGEQADHHVYDHRVDSIRNWGRRNPTRRPSPPWRNDESKQRSRSRSRSPPPVDKR